MPPKGRGAEAEINLAIDSDSLPLGTPSLTAKPKSIVNAIPSEIVTKISPMEFVQYKMQHELPLTAGGEGDGLLCLYQLKKRLLFLKKRQFSI